MEALLRLYGGFVEAVLGLYEDCTVKALVRLY